MIPHLFGKRPLAEITNPDLQNAILEVEKQKNQEQAAQKALEIITKKFRGYRFRTYVFFWMPFEADPNKLWARENDFMHCHHQNLLLRIMLVNSGWFKDSDISHGYSCIWYISIHQYLVVQFQDKKVTLDPWNQHFGCKWDEHATGFGCKRA